MGVINLTPDSFSDGGVYSDPLKALNRAKEFIDNGVDVVDLGAQSTRPGAQEITIQEELTRLIPVLELIRQNFPNLIISVDTFNSIVAERSIEAGANWINDISGGSRDILMYDLIARARCPYVLMHSRGNSSTMMNKCSYKNLVEEIISEMKSMTNKALSSGVKDKQIIWDPGLGFAKDTNQNIIILNQIDEFLKYNFPVLVGPSRKRFLGDILGINNPQSRLIGTAAVVSRCYYAGVSMVRVHDVSEINQFLMVSRTIY